MAELLSLDAVSAGYGAAIVLGGITLRVEDGRSLAVLGRNGTGKTTLINTVIGLTTQRGGSIHFAGRDVTRLRAEERAGAGIGWVPQERNVFRSLTVEENMTAVARPGPWTLDRLYAMFPRLRERRGNLGYQLSGGEQQMLAIARALALNPRLLLLDEPTEGLAPIIVAELLTALRRLAREDGLSMIVVEQNARKILGFTDEAIILDRGSIVHRAPSPTLLADASALETHLGVVGRAPARA
jgi:branched-chain amino acid transport system ATP-binding protein